MWSEPNSAMIVGSKIYRQQTMTYGNTLNKPNAYLELLNIIKMETYFQSA